MDSRAKFLKDLEQMITACITAGIDNRPTMFTALMCEARRLGLESETLQAAHEICTAQGEPDLWETPQPFPSGNAFPPFQPSWLPEPLSSYTTALCNNVQVYPDMPALPLLSAVSLCISGKAEVCSPGGDYTVPLNLYTATMAHPGERKSPCMKAISKPIYEYQDAWNNQHKTDIAKYTAQKANLEKQLQAAMAAQDSSEANKLSMQLQSLTPIIPLDLILQDVTPEAMIKELSAQNERMAVLDDEGTLIDVLSGIYSKKEPNTNIFLKAYDGSPCICSKIKSGKTHLRHPLITIGIMLQSSRFNAALIRQRQLTTNGFFQRFLYAFPGSKQGNLQMGSPALPQHIIDQYNDLIHELLELPEQTFAPVIRHTQESTALFDQYFRALQEKNKPGQNPDLLAEWYGKHFGRALKIAGIIHFVKHTKEAFSNDIDDDTASKAIEIARWCEPQAIYALCGGHIDTQQMSNAKKVLKKLKEINLPSIKRSELYRKLKLSSAEVKDALNILCDMRYIRFHSVDTAGRPADYIDINPYA